MTVRSGAGDLGADGGGKAVTHGAEAARGDEVTGLHEVVKLGGPHLVLPNLGGDDGVAVGDLVYLLADVLRHEFAIRVLLVRQREIPLPRRDLCQPRGVRRIPIFALHGPQLLDQAQQAHLHVTDDRQGDGDVLADRGWIDVDMDELGADAEFFKVAGDPVVEAGADGNDQIGLIHGHVRRVGAVHAQHAEPQVVAAGKAAQPHQGVGDRRGGEFAEFVQFSRRLGVNDATTRVDNRPLPRRPAFQRRAGFARRGRGLSACSHECPHCQDT